MGPGPALWNGSSRVTLSPRCAPPKDTRLNRGRGGRLNWIAKPRRTRRWLRWRTVGSISMIYNRSRACAWLIASMFTSDWNYDWSGSTVRGMWRREEARIRDSLWNFAFNGLHVTGIFHRQSFLPRKGKEKLTLSLCVALEKDRHRPRSFFWWFLSSRNLVRSK